MCDRAIAPTRNAIDRRSSLPRAKIPTVGDFRPYKPVLFHSLPGAFVLAELPFGTQGPVDSKSKDSGAPASVVRNGISPIVDMDVGDLAEGRREWP